ncbi:MAG: PAS domain-containing sensor histidine kinase [Candidatus Saccharimonadales bacterium]
MSSSQKLPSNAAKLDELMEVYVSRLEKKVAMESKSLQMMADAVPQIVWMADPEGKPDYYNMRWYAYTGLPPGSEGRTLNWSKVLHPEDEQKVKTAWQHSVKTGETFEEEFRLKKHETGQYRWFLGRARCGRDPKGDVMRWFGTSTDIHEYKQAQQDKDEFIAIASHELKTPITSIKLFTEVIKRQLSEKRDQKLVQQFNLMDGQVMRLSNLVDDLLDISRLDASKLDFRQEKFNIDQLIDDTVSNFRLTSADHIFHTESTPNLLVCADKHRVEQVLVNLITNGIKYSPDGSTITIAVKRQKMMVIVSVKDEGIGIPKSQQKQIFTRFFRVDDPRKKQDSTGLGLGLYISAEIVKREGGKIWLESTANKGSTFYFSLPLAV